MINILLNPNDKRYIFIAGDNPDELTALEQHMNPYISYTLLPTSKVPPTREIFLDKFNRNGRWIYWCAAGLWKEVTDFCAAKQFQITSAIDNAFKYTDFPLTLAEYTELVQSWNLNLNPRDYQIKAAWLILKYRLSLSELATRAGKTLIFYMVARAMKEVMHAHNILMIVPSIHLVKQGVKDLQDYQEYFECEQIWANGEEVQMSDLTIGTFQSLIRKADKRYKNYDPHFFDKFDVVCVDEAHKAPCKSIKTILSMDAFKHVKLRFGFTGTLPKPQTIEWRACQAILGPKIQEISSRELIDEGFLADPIIRQIRINYNPATLTKIRNRCGTYLLSSYVKDASGQHIKLPKEQRSMTMVHEKTIPTALQAAIDRLDPEEYSTYITDCCAASSKTLVLEQMMAMFSQPKIDIIDELIEGLHKNIIVFAHNTEYINYLYKHYKERFPERNIYKISGNSTLKSRQKSINKMLENDNNILVASFGCVGTGITLKRVDYGIFAQSFKADTITRQSLGRLMLRTEDKQEFYMYDIIDVFPTKKIRAQGGTKINIYKSEGHRNSVEEKYVDFVEIKNQVD